VTQGPRSAREALIAELLGDVDRLLARVEALPAQVAQAEAKVAGTITGLNEAGDRFRLAVTAFAEEARTGLAEYAQRKAGEAGSRAADEARTAMIDAAKQAFRSEAADKAAQLAATLAQASREFHLVTLGRTRHHGLYSLRDDGRPGALDRPLTTQRPA
jgi:hypothetical protein